MTVIIFGFALSVLVVLALGFVILRKWLQKQADLHIWTERQLKLREEDAEAKRREDPKTWRRNKQMNMR
jgi:H+/gluconate symporter-like permease